MIGVGVRKEWMDGRVDEEREWGGGRGKLPNCQQCVGDGYLRASAPEWL